MATAPVRGVTSGNGPRAHARAGARPGGKTGSVCASYPTPKAVSVPTGGPTAPRPSTPLPGGGVGKRPPRRLCLRLAPRRGGVYASSGGGRGGRRRGGGGAASVSGARPQPGVPPSDGEGAPHHGGSREGARRVKNDTAEGGGGGPPQHRGRPSPTAAAAAAAAAAPPRNTENSGGQGAQTRQPSDCQDRGPWGCRHAARNARGGGDSHRVAPITNGSCAAAAQRWRRRPAHSETPRWIQCRVHWENSGSPLAASSAVCSAGGVVDGWRHLVGPSRCGCGSRSGLWYRSPLDAADTLSTARVQRRWSSGRGAGSPPVTRRNGSETVGHLCDGGAPRTGRRAHAACACGT